MYETQAAPPPPLPSLGEGLGFMRTIWAVDQGLQRASRRMQRSIRVTGPQRLVIRLLGRFPGLTVTRLAALMHVHPSTVSEILDRLDRRGLLSRRQDTRDARRAYLGLTRKGRALDMETEPTVEMAVRRALRGFSPRQVSDARRVLLAVAESLLQAHEEPSTSRSRPSSRGPIPPAARSRRYRSGR